MSKYIEREAAYQTLTEYYHHTTEGMHSALREAISRVPAADVRPATRGEWIDHQEGRWIYAKCSECGTMHDVRSNFCPNCGAAMGGT